MIRSVFLGFLWLGISGAALASTDTAHEAFFPRRKMLVKYAEPTVAQLRIMDRIAQNAELVAGLVPASTEEQKVFRLAAEEVRGAPRWLCRTSCACPRGALGCEKIEQRNDWITGILVVDPCLVSSARCSKPVASKARELATIYERAAIARVARRRTIDQKLWAVQFESARRSLESLVSQCSPRPARIRAIESNEFALLSRAGLRLLEGETWSNCGQAVLSGLKKIESLVACRAWSSAIRNVLAVRSFDYFRCAGHCPSLLSCEEGERAKILTSPRGMGLILPADRCEGNRWVNREETLREILSSIGTKSNLNGCIDAANLEKEVRTTPASPSQQNSGPEVDLVY